MSRRAHISIHEAYALAALDLRPDEEYTAQQVCEASLGRLKPVSAPVILARLDGKLMIDSNRTDEGRRYQIRQRGRETLRAFREALGVPQ